MSTFKLYSSANTEAGAWKLIPSKLFKIDSIADYLATFTPTTITDAQYIKQGLEISIKVNMTQDKSQPNSASGYKYVSIQNSETERIAYYYVRKAVWRSQNTIQFDLVMDVLNTYNDGSDYVFKGNTRILREHKPRFYLKDYSLTLVVDNALETGVVSVGDDITLSWYDNQDDEWVAICDGKVETWNGDDLILRLSSTIDKVAVETAIKNNILVGNDFLFSKDVSNKVMARFSSYTLLSNLYRKIDFLSENINPLLLRNNIDTNIEDKSLLNQNWYLLYRNQNDPSESLVNPVNCYLIPQNNVDIYDGVVSEGRINPAALNADTWYYVRIPNGVTFILSNGYTLTSSGYSSLCITKQSNNKMSIVVGDNTMTGMSMIRTYDDIDYVSFSAFPIPYEPKTSSLSGLQWHNLYGNETQEWSSEYEGDVIDGIEMVDRTDAKNIKLIKLPYCPYNFTISGNKLQIAGTDWFYTTISQANSTSLKVIRLNNQNIPLTRTLDVSSSARNPFDRLYFGETLIDITSLRKPVSSRYESKLFHSEFYAPTYVYDSFSLHIDLERCDLTYYIDNYNVNDVKFTMTSTINSKFLFTFASYVADKNVENFYKIIPVARNNEMVLYNVPYINYIRNGFNYDVKQKNISNATNFLGLGLSGLSVAASFALPSVPLKALGIVASIIGLANSIKSTITETIKNEEALKQKLIQAQNQTSSVAGSDDVDLMSEYCDNRLKYFIYRPTDNMINLINDLFFYAGYNSGRMGLPNHNTRINFDYLECDASLESAGANIPQEILEEIKNSYKTGVTFIHKASRVSDKWDIEQKYENWEVELVEG